MGKTKPASKPEADEVKTGLTPEQLAEQAADKAEADRLAAEAQAEADKAEADKVAAEKAEAERVEAEKKAEAEKAEAEKEAAEKAQAEAQAEADPFDGFTLSLEQYLLHDGFDLTTAPFAAGVLIRAVGAYPRTLREWKDARATYLGGK